VSGDLSRRDQAGHGPRRPRITRREQDDPLRRVHATPHHEPAHDAAHRAFRRVSIDVPALEVDTSDGYRPPFGQILSFVTGTMGS
jgi:hypothetical protein